MFVKTGPGVAFGKGGTHSKRTGLNAALIQSAMFASDAQGRLGHFALSTGGTMAVAGAVKKREGLGWRVMARSALLKL